MNERSSQWVRSIRIGSLTIENNLLQAPLAGYSAAPFRVLAWQWGRPGLLATEMISARALCLGAPRQEKYLARDPAEGPVAFQLWGADPESLGEAARIVTDRGADVVDLNCGCPVRKVRAAGAGSKLMEAPSLVGRIVRAMRAATDRPVTVKIRVGVHAQNYNGPEVARAAEEAGADMIAVHGRHARERYSHPCRLEEIARVVDAVSVPVAGNGDVRDGASARRMFEITGCAAVMVGRACMGAPWVFRTIRAGLAGEASAPPSREEIGRLFLEHCDRLAGLVGTENAVRQCRKLGCFYARAMPGAKNFRDGLNRCRTREELADLVERTFFQAGARSGA